MNSSAGIWATPTKVIKASAHHLAPTLADLFNKALLHGQLPDEWKFAVVTPLYKNKGDRQDPNSYRGISVQTQITKILETLAAAQIRENLTKNNIISQDQHGFRPGHSCKSALHEIIASCYIN